MDFGDIRIRVCEIESISYLIFFNTHLSFGWWTKPFRSWTARRFIMATATATATAEVLPSVPAQR